MEDKTSRADYMRAYRKTHADELRPKNAARMRRWRAEHPDRVKEQNHEQYLKRKARKEAERTGRDD